VCRCRSWCRSHNVCEAILLSGGGERETAARHSSWALQDCGELVECGVGVLCSFLSSCGSAHANVRRKLINKMRMRASLEREMDLKGLASVPTRRMDMASSCFPTLFVQCVGHEPVIGGVRERKGEEQRTCQICG